MGTYNKSINIFTQAKIEGKYKPNNQISNWSNGEPYTYVLIKGETVVANTSIYNYFSPKAIFTEGPPVYCIFSFTNISDEPIIIQNVQTSCGCVVGSWDKEPVQPHKKGTIKISYSTQGRVGHFQKNATVTTTIGIESLKIISTVDKAPTEPTQNTTTKH